MFDGIKLIRRKYISISEVILLSYMFDTVENDTQLNGSEDNDDKENDK